MDEEEKRKMEQHKQEREQVSSSPQMLGVEHFDMCENVLLLLTGRIKRRRGILQGGSRHL